MSASRNRSKPMEQSPITDPTLFSRFLMAMVCGQLLISGCSDSKGESPKSAVVAPPPTLEALPAPDKPADDLQLVETIRKFIIGNSPEKEESEMRDYTRKIPTTGVPFEMVAIPGGEFLMGSPANEPDRREDEGPQRTKKVEPFWIGKFEVTWDIYEPFMLTDVARNKDGSRLELEENELLADVVSAPTTPYSEMSFGMGTKGYPAISMTQHAASKFCQWLSAQTGHFYRLPTEAEWEYACRAGTSGPFHCVPEELADYAVFDPTQTRIGYEKVGTKKPNPWGLHDMHGNVLEWCLDQYFSDAYRTGKQTIPATKLYPRVVRGGSWYDTAELCRSAAREKSTEDWIQLDPELPKSLWYLPDAVWLGFRIVRPLKPPSAEAMEAIWNSGMIWSNGSNVR